MYKFCILLITSAFILSFHSFGQEEQWQVERREKTNFSNTLDSLFLENQYHKIIEICGDASTGSIRAYNLIGVYYFLGDSVKSWDLLNKEISRIGGYNDAYAYDNLLNTEYTSYKKFLINSSAKSYILKIMDSVYKMESHTDKPNGLELLHLLIEDQWVRNTSDLYDKFKPERRFLLPSQMDSMQAIQAQHDHCTTVFNFYKKHNKIFSKAEVGRIHYWQMMLFFHEWDLERRKFYHELVINAVENDVLEMKDRANFEAGTEYIILGVDEFFKRRAELEESYKKKYSLPDNYRIMLM